MYGLPSRTPSAFRTLSDSPQPGDERTSGSPQPGDGSTSGSSQLLVNCLAAPHCRAHSVSKFCVLTWRLTRHSKIPSV
ncbi:hypothetical protein PoB_003935100 [Plakobranchus ocellatus]|uniref:Uncharacterized protein n=1 Tax=Plakobranchus ocellatus TaxID=259542 RepID=A0AAV4AX95_9GAST|nr:hypothetical protein PoB_003935100 [Plakobranchus ocellatus]